jgi:hypothetical protein
MKQMIVKTINAVILLLIAVNFTFAQKKLLPAPDLTNVKYGDHERNVLDVWFADKSKTTPLAIYIHGGGFKGGSKERVREHSLAKLLKAGISVASINYRYISNAPLPAAHHDAKQALQFIRSKAEEWNIDKDRIAAYGGSAGAQICMWLAFSDDMANAESNNPIERESTRLSCVASGGGQTTMEFDFWEELIEKHLGDKYGAEYIAKIFGDKNKAEQDRITTYGAKTIDEANETAKSLSALSLVSADDPPIFMHYSMSPDAEAPGNPKKRRGWVVHHVDFGIKLKEKMDVLNVETHLQYPDSKTKYKSLVEFFADKLY